MTNQKFDPVLCAARLTSKHYTPPRGAKQLKHALRSVQSAHGARNNRALSLSILVSGLVACSVPVRPVLHKRHTPKVRKSYTSKAYRAYMATFYAVWGINVANSIMHQSHGAGHMRKYLARVDPVNNPLTDPRKPLLVYALPDHPGPYQGTKSKTYAHALATWAESADGKVSMAALAEQKLLKDAPLPTPRIAGYFTLRG